MLFILEDNADRIQHFQAALGTRPHHIERTVPEAREWLAEHAPEVTLYSLDNDLYVPDYDGEPGEGWELFEWMRENVPERPVIVHTTNSHAATKMEMGAEADGWDIHRVVPFMGMEWIGKRWIETVRELMD